MAKMSGNQTTAPLTMCQTFAKCCYQWVIDDSITELYGSCAEGYIYCSHKQQYELESHLTPNYNTPHSFRCQITINMRATIKMFPDHY